MSASAPSIDESVKTMDYKHPFQDRSMSRDDDVEKVEDDSTDRDSQGSRDQNLVDFEGSDDPEHPHNWTPLRKWSIVGALSIMTMITPLASSMFAPGVQQVMDEFHSTSIILSAFVVSIYILGYATGPLFIAPLSELYGRNIVYHVSNVMFVIFTIICAVSQSLGMLIGFRFLAGIAGSTVLTNGGGTIADMFVQQERGKAMSIWSMGPLLGPVIGPVCGGFLAQAAGWRWVFWVLTIAGGVMTVVMLLVLHETYPPIILARKTRHLRKLTGNTMLHSALDTDSHLTTLQIFAKAIVRPCKMLLQPIVLLLSLFTAMTYGYLYLLFTTINTVFEDIYGFTTGTVGLAYLGIGIGMLSSLFIFGSVSDRLLKSKAAKGEMKPEYRLVPMPFGCVFIPVGLFIYGWTAQYHVFWFVPIFGTSLFGFGILVAYMCIQTYLVDAYTRHASSALAASTVVRSLAGAFLPMAGPSLNENLGVGWGASVLGFIALAFLPVPVLFYRYGERIRKSPRFQTTF